VRIGGDVWRFRVPTASGHVKFCALARAGVTGLRETLVMATRRDESDDGEPDPATLAAGERSFRAAQDVAAAARDQDPVTMYRRGRT
jgi:hypothetical protein